jgi:hypothetical protein
LISISRENPLIGGSALRLVGTFSNKATALGVPSWNWSDAATSKAFFSAIEVAFESGDALQKIAAMDALAAFGQASDQGRHIFVMHT